VELLEHPFASPTHALLGRVGARQSLDGWRDDEFPRNIGFRTSSLKTLEELVVSGQAVAYLPDYLGDALDLAVVRVTGCPYTCTQVVRLVARSPRDTSWLARLF
jgi:DNA-binding transcriptional LysR family regulator